MSSVAIVWLVISALIVIGIVILIRTWISIYNKFQYWITRAQRKFADVDIIMQERLDLVLALSQIAKKYDIHEYKALKDVIEARSKWTKDTELNDKVKLASEVENNYLKLQAVFERYPDLKADKMHISLMEKDSKIEKRLREKRLEYNRVAQKYNERTRRFPRNLVAQVHNFNELDYLTFGEQPVFEPREIFNDEP